METQGLRVAMVERFGSDSQRLPADQQAGISPAHASASTGLTGIGSKIADRFRELRFATESLAAPLSAEDQAAQSMPDASPTKWHLAHTTWFFETFILIPRGIPVYDPAFGFLFNSYYEALGERQPRASRGLITRPSCDEVMAYRRHVDAAVLRVLEHGDFDADLTGLMDLGIAHEEQHQELLLMDVQHLLAQNPLSPQYLAGIAAPAPASAAPLSFSTFQGSLAEIGHDGGGFSFDIEGPRHTTYLQPFRLADRPVTNGEWLAFMEDGGYRRPELWLSDGWTTVQAEGWRAPLYWRESESGWSRFSLRGRYSVEPQESVVHVSYYEADAFARWSGRRLPTEAEWEVASATASAPGVFMEDGVFAPRAVAGDGLTQMFGGVWEWTATPYTPYPKFRPTEGAVGEYNGKFAVNQMVLRGGCCFTPRRHIRPTYRNFFHPHQRWQAAGVRLADD
jgi:ergothioneine biosynthesis protein EgtB